MIAADSLKKEKQGSSKVVKSSFAVLLVLLKSTNSQNNDINIAILDNFTIFILWIIIIIYVYIKISNGESDLQIISKLLLLDLKSSWDSVKKKVHLEQFVFSATSRAEMDIQPLETSE